MEPFVPDPKDEEAIQSAVRAYRDLKATNADVNIAAFTRQRNIDLQRFRRRLQGRPSKKDYARFKSKKLNESQFQLLYQYIDQIVATGTSITPKVIENAANSILEWNHSNPAIPVPKVGKNWPYRFFKHHPQYSRVKRKMTDPRRADGDGVELIDQWLKTADIGPPFTEETAKRKVKAAQDLWNTRDPSQVVEAYTDSTIWRNRSTFLRGKEEVYGFLIAKWQREANYRLRKELFCFREDKIAVQFWYEYQDVADGMKWKRCYGLEDWTFETQGEEAGKMRKRQMSGNDVMIGPDGNGEGRWFGDHIEDVNSVTIGEDHW